MNIILGVCGGIAAYKAAELLRLLKANGVSVKVVMTQGAQAFVGPLTFQALSQEPVYDDLFDPEQASAMDHIHLARWADYIVIVPATAQIMAKLAQGWADDLLTTLVLAARCQTIVVPAMNAVMWENQATQTHYRTLLERGFILLGPEYGEQACGEFGLGRLYPPDKIVDFLLHDQNSPCWSLRGQTWLVTAGPTQEPMDPIRYLSNRSSGRMGFAMAEAAARAGANVILVSGPVSTLIHIPQAIQSRVSRINVMTALQMHAAVAQYANQVDVFVSCAAVSDYRFETSSSEKHKKSEQAKIQVNWIVNPDIVCSVAAWSKPPFIVMFAAETQADLTHVQSKMITKQADVLVLNQITASNPVFDANENEVTVFTRDKPPIFLPQSSKMLIASKLINLIQIQLSAMIGLQDEENVH